MQIKVLSYYLIKNNPIRRYCYDHCDVLSVTFRTMYARWRGSCSCMVVELGLGCSQLDTVEIVTHI